MGRPTRLEAEALMEVLERYWEHEMAKKNILEKEEAGRDHFK